MRLSSSSVNSEIVDLVLFWFCFRFDVRRPIRSERLPTIEVYPAWEAETWSCGTYSRTQGRLERDGVTFRLGRAEVELEQQLG